jgi:hypothetical protein
MAILLDLASVVLHFGGTMKLLNQAVTQFRENKTWDIPQTKVFISVGDKEHSGIVPTMVKYSSYLEQSDYDNIELKNI